MQRDHTSGPGIVAVGDFADFLSEVQRSRHDLHRHRLKQLYNSALVVLYKATKGKRPRRMFGHKLTSGRKLFYVICRARKRTGDTDLDTFGAKELHIVLHRLGLPVRTTRHLPSV